MNCPYDAFLCVSPKETNPARVLKAQNGYAILGFGISHEMRFDQFSVS